MAIKKTTKPQTADMLPVAQNDGSPKPLVSLTIARPEPVLAGAQKLLARVHGFQIKSPEVYAEAANIRQEIRAEHDAMEARRVKMKKPIIAAGKEVDDLFKPAISVLAEAIEEITDRMSNWDRQQRAIAEQKQREAEVEAQRVREEAERQAAEARRQTQMAMSEIQGINQQLMIASVGRAGVRKGGTLECIRETLAETEKWPIEEAHFGTLYGAAVRAKETVIAGIKAVEQNFLARVEQDRIAKEQADARAAGDAERVKKAEADAAVEHQKAVEARKAQLRAEAQQREAAQSAATDAAASQANIEQLEHVAANTVAEEVKADIVQVAGLSRPKITKWRLLDKSKLKPEFLLVDEKTISRMVSTAKTRAHEMVGVGAIEIYEEEGLRQAR